MEDNSSLVSDGNSLVRFDNPVEVSASSEAGPSHEVSGGQQESGSRKLRKQRRKKSKLSRSRLTCQSVESSPGRDCPSPDSLLKIIYKSGPSDLL